MQRILSLLLLLAAAAASAQNTILWEVTDSVHHKTSYLLGTYHQLGNHFADAHPVIAEKLLAAELAIFESDSEGDTLAALLARTPSDAYQKALGKKYARRLDDMSGDWLYPPEKLRPEELMVKLQQSYFQSHCGNVIPSDSFSHFDIYLIHLARTNHIPVLGLETDSLQLEIINASTGAGNWKQIKPAIKYWIDAHLDPSKEEKLCAFTRRYKQFDLDYDLAKPCDPTDQLVVGRNANWMAVLPDKLRQQNCFVAVGLLHLFYECGLVQQLRNAGFTVREVPMK